MTIPFAGWDWLTFAVHFLSLSLFSVGGIFITVPEMHRFLVDDRHWITDSQFTGSMALAQSAPGPNVLFVAVVGWTIGANAGGGLGANSPGWWSATLGVTLALLGILAPSSILTYFAGRWARRNRNLCVVRAFKNGMAPIVTALLLATAWLLTSVNGPVIHVWPVYLLTGLCTLIAWRTRIHLLWLIAAGGGLGALGFV